MFRGTFEHTIDNKGRASVPTRFRDELLGLNDDRVVITNFFFQSLRCLDVYPLQAWEELEAKLRARPQFDVDVMRFQQYYLARAHECQLDKQGRILLPPILRTYAGLNRDIVFAGASDKFQVWDHELWGTVFADAEQSLMTHPEGLSRLGI